MGILDAPGLTPTAATKLFGPTRASRALVPVADRAFPQNDIGTPLSSGNLLSTTYRIRHKLRCSGYSFYLVYTNIQNVGGVETPGPNTITVKASVDPGSNPTPASSIPVFAGWTRTVDIPPGAAAVLGPVAIDMTSPQDFYTRTTVSVASLGQKWPLGLTTIQVGEGNTSTVSGADRVDGPWTTGDVQTTAKSYGPAAIWAVPTEPVDRVFGIVADSIGAGYGEENPGVDTGFIQWALMNNGAKSWQQTAYASAGIPQFFSPQSYVRKGLFLPATTDFICELGTNNLSGSTFAQMQGYLQQLWNELSRRGARIHQTTILPTNTSTDGWTTTANQTVKAVEPVRVAVNNWIRTKPAPLSSVIESADIAETARNSGIWKVDQGPATQDGVHVRTGMAQRLAAALPASRFS